MGAPRLLRHGDKEVVVFTTPSGVRACVATCISVDALERFAAALRRRMLQQQRSVQPRASKGT
jgi:hypothetical protein